jgi:hypothetical protein
MQQLILVEFSLSIFEDDNSPGATKLIYHCLLWRLLMLLADGLKLTNQAVITYGNPQPYQPPKRKGTGCT